MTDKNPVLVEPFSYLNLKSAPNGYACHTCKATNCKLWREYNTFLSHQSLRCSVCALARESSAKCTYEAIDNNGRLERTYYLNGEKRWTSTSDQIGWLVPAVPTEEGDTYWGYTSVPPEGVIWWRSLRSIPEVSQAPQST